MGTEDPLAEPQLFGQGPAADGLVVADLPEYLVALGDQVHHFRNQFILQLMIRSNLMLHILSLVVLFLSHPVRKKYFTTSSL